jgi:hypothetical protein
MYRTGRAMPHFFKDTSHRPGSKEFIGIVLQLQNTAPVGEGSCVDLIKTYCPTLAGKTTSTWRAGKLSLLALAFIASGLVPSTEASAIEKVPQCPASYPLEGVALTKVPAGWKGRVDARFHLQSAAVIEGPPEERENLYRKSAS